MNIHTKQHHQKLYANRRTIADKLERRRLEKFISAIEKAENAFKKNNDCVALAMRLEPYWQVDRDSRYVLPVLRATDKDLAHRTREAFSTLRILKGYVRDFAERHWFVRILM